MQDHDSLIHSRSPFAFAKINRWLLRQVRQKRGENVVRINQLQPTPTIDEPLEIPTELLASVRRHQAHLAALVASLRAAGLDDRTVDASVLTLVDSYAQELTIAIRAMMNGSAHG